jgi:Na+/citrate or Na+/malate symporter
MIDFTKPHNWVGLLVAMLVIGFVLKQVAARVPSVDQVRRAAGQS